MPPLDRKPSLLPGLVVPSMGVGFDASTNKLQSVDTPIALSP